MSWAADEAKSPPDGWKEYTAKDKSFTVWMPESQGRLKDNIKTAMPKKGMMLRLTTATCQRAPKWKRSVTTLEGKKGPTYEAAAILISPYMGEITKLKAAERVDLIRDWWVEDSKGKVSDEKDIKQGRVPGKEFVIETKEVVSRHRVYSFADRFFAVSVSGTKEQVTSKDATTFLDSYRIPEKYRGPADKEKDK
jgi:hypothetical protein